MTSLRVAPLRPDVPVPAAPEQIDNDAELAEWLAYVGLGGRWAYATGHGWLRLDGTTWKQSHEGYVMTAVRLALYGLYQREMLSARFPIRDLMRLNDVNRAIQLRRRVKKIVRVDRASVEVQR